MANFDTMLTGGFGVVTVMNAKLYKCSQRYSGSRGTQSGRYLSPTHFYASKITLDTLKIANLTMEGPTKTITGGQYANPLIKYGKTMTIEMQDALGTKDALVEFMGCNYVNGRLSVTDKFPGPFAIEGETFFIDQQTGEKVPVYIFIPQLLPDAIFNLTQDAEGDATVFDLNGSVCLTGITGPKGDANREVFYEIRGTSFFDGETLAEEDPDGKEYLIVFDPNYAFDGTNHSMLTVDQKITTLPTLTRDGYTFDGWYTNSQGTGTAVTTATKFTGGTTLYAKWTAQAGA